MAEYIAKINDSKKEAVADLKSRFDGISSFIFTDYRGLTVAQITEIRDKLRTSDTEFKVVKNRFAKIAMKDMGITEVDDFLKHKQFYSFFSSLYTPPPPFPALMH